MNQTLKMVRRLQAADELLAGDGLHAPSFARVHRLSTKSVQRILAALRELGFPSEARRDSSEWKSAYRHFYLGDRRMFSAE